MQLPREKSFKMQSNDWRDVRKAMDSKKVWRLTYAVRQRQRTTRQHVANTFTFDDPTGRDDRPGFLAADAVDRGNAIRSIVPCALQ